VALNQQATFRIVDGTIYGASEGNADLRNNASSNGAALIAMSQATAERGTFSGEIWNSLGSLATTSDTIKVANGKIVQ